MSKTYKHQATYDYLHGNRKVGKHLRGILRYFNRCNYPRWDGSRLSWYKHKIFKQSKFTTMTREEARKAAEVMMAYANSEKIESLFCDEYIPCEEPTFNWTTAKGVENYRIKPKEKFDPNTLKPFDKVLVRDDRNEKWQCSLFSYINIIDDIYYPYVAITTGHKCCIPYNDDTKHLVGTSDEAPEYYRYWEE